MKKLLCMLTALCLLAGCGARETESAPEPEPVSPVYTDWSKLTPYEPSESLYTYFDPYSGTGPLQPRDDYGPLLPYIGAEVSVDNYIMDSLPLYGLATGSGQLVTAPCYADISIIDEFLLLYEGSPDGVVGSDSWAGGTYKRTLAALDGSWVRELDGYWPGSAGHGLLVTCGSDGSLTFWNTAGEAAAQFPSTLFAPWFKDTFCWGEEGGPWLDWQDDRVVYITSYNHSPGGGEPLRLYLDLKSGTVAQTPPEGYPAEIDYEQLYEKPPGFPGYRNIQRITDPVTKESCYEAYTDTEGPSEHHLLSEDGEVLLSDFEDLWVSFPQIINGCAARVEHPAGSLYSMAGGTFGWYRLDSGECVFRFPIRSNAE